MALRRFQFIVSKTNKRKDVYGGSYENRIRFPVEIIKQMRAAVGDDFIIVFRLSMLDLVEEGSSWEEIAQLGVAVRDAGATIINTGIGWHEARIPTIATQVPRGAFAWFVCLVCACAHVNLSPSPMPLSHASLPYPLPCLPAVGASFFSHHNGAPPCYFVLAGSRRR